MTIKRLKKERNRNIFVLLLILVDLSSFFADILEKISLESIVPFFSYVFVYMLINIIITIHTYRSRVFHLCLVKHLH